MRKFSGLAPVVQRVENAIHRINHYPMDGAIDFAITYPLDSAIDRLINWGLGTKPGCVLDECTSFLFKVFKENPSKSIQETDQQFVKFF